MTSIFEGKWVFDANLLLYFLDGLSSFHPKAKDIFSLITKGKIMPFVTQQNMIETQNVLLKTYKKKPRQALRLVEGVVYDFSFTIIFPLHSTYGTYHGLLTRCNSAKIDIFDYYLAATILDNGINRILTANTKDFSKIKQIKAVDPFK